MALHRTRSPWKTHSLHPLGPCWGARGTLSCSWEPLGRWSDPHFSALPRGHPPQGSVGVLHSPLRWHRSAGRKGERASVAIPSLPHPPALPTAPSRLWAGGPGTLPRGGTSLLPAPFTPQPGHRSVGSLQVELCLQPFGMSLPRDPPVPPPAAPRLWGTPSCSPTHFKGLLGRLEPLDTLKLVGGTMTSRVCPCAGGSSLASRGLPGSGRRGGWCLGTAWGHRRDKILRGAAREPLQTSLPLQS